MASRPYSTYQEYLSHLRIERDRPFVIRRVSEDQVGAVVGEVGSDFAEVAEDQRRV